MKYISKADDNDRCCDICWNKGNRINATTVIKGDAICHHCGNEIVLCDKHFAEFLKEVKEYTGGIK